MDKSGNGCNRSSMSPSPHYSKSRNSYDDSYLATRDAGTLGNFEQQQQQQQQAQEDLSQFSDLTMETPLLVSWHRTLANNGSDNWEPYPLNPSPPTSHDQNQRSEALRAFLDLAMIHRGVLVGGETSTSMGQPPRGEEAKNKEEEPADAYKQDPRRQDMKPSPIESPSPSRRDQSQITQQQGESIADFLDVHYAKPPRIRDFQEQQWEKHYMDLVEFHQREGHCCVPNAYKDNPALARWVKRQRYQYKLRQQQHQHHQQGSAASSSNNTKSTTMVPHRMKALERLGFVWESHAALWEEQLQNLKAFLHLYGHCNVPSVFPANPQLSTWVKRQRRQYRDNNICQSRKEKLNAIGFDWKTKELPPPPPPLRR